MKAVFDGEIRVADQILVPIASETALRGANVFEGLRAYRNAGSMPRILEPVAHLERLMQSAQLIAIDHKYSVTYFARQIARLLRDSNRSDDLYIRPSIVVVGGRSPSDANYRAVDYIAMAPASRRDLWRPATAIVSSHRKASGGSLLPPQAKVGGAYLQFRLATQEQLAARADHVILLNEAGRVAEAAGSAVVAVFDGTLVSPPTSEGALPSVTWRVIRRLGESLGIPTEERPIARSDLLRAEAVVLAGTLGELVPLASIGGSTLTPDRSHHLELLLAAYDELRNGRAPKGVAMLTIDELDKVT